MYDTATLWLQRLGVLNVDPDKGRGRAPHKPLLLLAVLDLVEAGLLSDYWLTLSPDLVLRFRDLWPIVQERRQNQGDIRMPFHALGSRRDRVWEVFDTEGRPSFSRDTTTRARIPDGLLSLLGDAKFRSALRRRLVGSYFPPAEQVELAVSLNFESELDSAEVAQFAKDRDAYRAARKRGRSARFKIQVVSGYHRTCALTGYRLNCEGLIERGLVHAAHIHEHASSGNDDLDNGFALTPTAHALFDLGLWSVSDDLRVLVRPKATFSEEFPEGGFSLRAFTGRPLFLRSAARLRPSPVHLAWHRTHHGFAG